MTDPVVLVLEETPQEGVLADFAGNRLILSADALAALGKGEPAVAKVEVARPEVEGEPS